MGKNIKANSFMYIDSQPIGKIVSAFMAVFIDTIEA